MVGIIHCGTGNIGSVVNAIEHLGGDARIVNSPGELEGCERIILPGVGSFLEGMGSMRSKGFETAFQKHTIELGKPTLGICLGMQLMAAFGSEGGGCSGLGWFQGSVQKLLPRTSGERIPHVGWNQLIIHREHNLLKGVATETDFYFVHSYGMQLENDADLIASCDYANGVAAIVGRDNIFASQFHPEKSQDSGLKLLENFLDWNP